LVMKRQALLRASKTSERGIPRVCRMVRTAWATLNPRPMKWARVLARASPRRSASDGEHTGHIHGEPQVMMPWKATRGPPSGSW
jgi:hypothetical protein